MDDTGNVGIQTPLPLAPLTVGGNAGVLGNLGVGTSNPSATVHLSRPLGRSSIRFESSRFDQGAPLSTQATPGSASQSDAGQPWNNPTAARISNDTWATVDLSEIVGTPDMDQSLFLDLTNLGFNLPSGAEVTGIIVSVEGHGSASCADCERAAINVLLELLGGDSATGQRGMSLTSPTDVIVSSGGPSDTWNVEWSPQQVNAAGFGVRLIADLVVGNNFCPPFGGCGILPCDCTGSGTAFIDAVSITVHYFDAPSTTSPVDFSVGLLESDKLFRIAPTADLTSPAVMIDQTGNVGIGIVPQFNTKLAVNGIASKPGGGQWSMLSDARLKKNTEPIQDALPRLLSLRGVSFEYIEQALQTGLALRGRQTELIAQEVEQVFPEWVVETSGGYKMVSETGTIALLIEALRELRAEKDAQIKLLSERILELETRLEGEKAPQSLIR